MVTLALGGTATKGTDYVVTPADADREAEDYQVVLPVESNSIKVTLKAMSDDVDDPDEKIEVVAMVEGRVAGDMRAVKIMQQQMELPKITLAADRDTIIAGLEHLVLNLEREAPLDSSLAVTLRLAQDQNWLSDLSYEITLRPNEARATLILVANRFSSAVTESGTLTATVDSVSGYDTGEATAAMHVVSRLGPAVRASIDDLSYTFAEDGEDAFVTIFAWTAPGMPRGATVTFSVVSTDGTATSGDDYLPLSQTVTVQEQDFRLVGDRWVARHRLPVSLLDDAVREDTESFDLLLEQAPGHPSELHLANIGGDDCQDTQCPHPVYITDDEDIPVLELSVNPAEIREEGESSSIATVSITNGKTFATDQVVTFTLGGDAIPEHDYTVTPADADEEAAGHQVTLTAGSNSVGLTFTARNDKREEGDERITISSSLGDFAIGSAAIRIVDRLPGPRVEITFEGVQPPRDEYDDGIATGPFTTRIRFSEQVEGFTEKDINWQTHSLTTVDTTNIGVLLWDYTEVRAGLEYTVRMMPDQNGRLHILVFPDSARSVATGDGNQLGHGSLQVELPPNRMMVAPTALTVDEGDEDGAVFMVLLTSRPTGTVTVTASGMAGTDVAVDCSTWTFQLPYWSGGWGVKVTAGDDADTRDERVTLTVRASGGGYDGRIANVVVNVGDDDGLGGDVDDEAGALRLLQGLTPEAAAAALFGEGDLSEEQLGALDRLGNGNGKYDLGDLLAWNARCRRGEASCGGIPPDPRPAAAALLLAGGAGGRGGRQEGRPRRRHSQRRASHTRRRRASLGWLGLAFLLAAVTTGACADDIVEPRAAEPDPGYLTVELAGPPAARDIGALLVVEGPGIDSVRAPGFELFQSESPAPRQIIVAGTLTTGPIAEFQVPDRALHAQYRVRLLEVTGADYSLRDLTEYEVVITR